MLQLKEKDESSDIDRLKTEAELTDAKAELVETKLGR